MSNGTSSNLTSRRWLINMCPKRHPRRGLTSHGSPPTWRGNAARNSIYTTSGRSLKKETMCHSQRSLYENPPRHKSPPTENSDEVYRQHPEWGSRGEVKSTVLALHQGSESRSIWSCPTERKRPDVLGLYQESFHPRPPLQVRVHCQWWRNSQHPPTQPQSAAHPRRVHQRAGHQETTAKESTRVRHQDLTR